MPLTNEMQRLVNTERFGVVGTVNPNGNPQLVPIGSLIAITHDVMAFVCVTSPQLIANIGRNPTVSIVVVDQATGLGVRASGAARVITNPEQERDVLDRFAEHSRDLPAGPSRQVVTIDVYEATVLKRPLVDQADGSTDGDPSTMRSKMLRR